MIRHLKNLHQEKYLDFLESPDAFVPRLEDVLKNRPYARESRKKIALDDLLLKMLAMDLRPLSTVESPGFINFVKELDPR